VSKQTEVMPAPLPRLVDLKGAARYLSTTIWQMRTLVWEKRVPHVRLGKKILFDLADLDKLVESMKVNAA
jgi:excisionase family DNA binding protein